MVSLAMVSSVSCGVRTKVGESINPNFHPFANMLTEIRDPRKDQVQCDQNCAKAIKIFQNLYNTTYK
jgi:hypothetical protein